MEETQQTETKNWQKKQDALAERAGLSVLVVEGHQPPALAVSNNNSICRVVQSSSTHAERCEPFCGSAFQKATEAGKPISYRCHAGLYCVAAPLQIAEKPLVAIVGRTFLKTADYRDLTERIFLGDWQNLPEVELFESVNLSGSLEDLENLAARLQNLNPEEKNDLLALTNNAPRFNEEETTVLPDSETDLAEIAVTANDVLELDAPEPIFPEADSSEVLILDETEIAAEPEAENLDLAEAESAQNPDLDSTRDDFRAWSEKTASLRQSYDAAASATLDFIAETFGLENLVWLEGNGQDFKTLRHKGEKFGDNWRLNLAADDNRLRQAAADKISLRLENKNTGEEIELFPVAANAEEIIQAIVVGNVLRDDETRRLSDFVAQIALPLEVLRLREDVRRRSNLQSAIKKFNSDLQNADGENFLDALVENSVALVGASRGSLLFFDENEQKLRAAAATGRRAEEIKNETANLGERVAIRVWQEAVPMLVANAESLNLPPAPAERGYKSKSFLSVPLSVGGKKIGVLNVADKQENIAFDEADLQLLEAIAPQFAIALDRAVLHQKAGEYETASITDALTGLLNRRYLVARLDEEIRRSQRHGYPLSFMMIDVDFFKHYNDTYGHPAGDEALRIVANCLKAALRSADVAARYGGEEFSILLPQTTQSEARAIGERIRRRIESTVFPHQKVTISGGIAAFSPQLESPQAVIQAADEALFEAKRAGRNNVQIYKNGNGGHS
jgi:diguanylate cyclase (GGDEF)-like protein